MEETKMTQNKLPEGYVEFGNDQNKETMERLAEQEAMDVR